MEKPKHSPGIFSIELSRPLVEAGIVPPNTNRIVIDIPANGVVGVYYSVFADERLIEILPGLIANMPIGQMLTQPEPRVEEKK